MFDPGMLSLHSPMTGSIGFWFTVPVVTGLVAGVVGIGPGAGPGAGAGVLPVNILICVLPAVCRARFSGCSFAHWCFLSGAVVGSRSVSANLDRL